MFKIKEIIEVTNGKLINGDTNEDVSEFYISSKNHYKNKFYIPITWREEDRQQYIIDAAKSGVKGYLISDLYEQKDEIIAESIKINPNIIIIQVENINTSIYKMASYKRNKMIDNPIIAVTGSVGKTSTTEMISSIIREEKNVFSDTGNNNAAPLLSWIMLDIDNYEMAVLEAGMARKNVMEPISELLKPSVVVINNIGTSHIGNLGSKEEILEEKLKLTSHMKDEKILLLNDDDSMLKNIKSNDIYTVKKYSLKEAKNINQKEEYINFETNVYGENTKFELKAYGIHNVSNAICAIRASEIFNIKKENIQNGIRNYRNVDRRFNVINKSNYIIVDDAYNASIDSMKAGLITSNEMKNCKRKIAVLGDMLELGEYSEELHRQVGEIFKEVDFDILLTQGENSKYICENARKYMKDKKVINFEIQEDLIKYLLNEIKEGDLIYLKASKKMNFDNIVKEL